MKKKLLLLSACAIFLFTGCFGTKKTDVPKKASDVEIKTNKTEGLNLTTNLTSNNEVIFTVKNESSELIDYVNIDVAFYDKSGNLIKTDKQYVRNINADQESFVKMSLAQYDEDGKSTLPYKIEVVLNKTIYSSKFETVYTDKVEATVSTTETENQLTLNVNNTSGETLDDVNVAVVYYKNSKPVDVLISTFQSVGETTSQTIYVPTTTSDENVKALDYDEVKAIVNSASKYITQ